MAQPNYFNGPIPGQSLTQDPSAAGSWERPPKYTTVNQAIDHMFKVCTSKEFMKNYSTLLQEDKKFYVDELVSGMLSDGFVKGLWTVDMMMLMVEPMIILMVWVAAQLNHTVSFSTDTGSEDRTGFMSLEEMVGMDTEGQFGEEDQAQQVGEEAQLGELPQQQQSPLLQGNQSPLVTGAPQATPMDNAPSLGGM